MARGLTGHVLVTSRPEKGEPGGDPATAGEGVGHELIHQAGDPGICGYLHLQ